MLKLSMSVEEVFSCDTAHVGRIVISRAGHDKGEIYVIVDTADLTHVGVADGTTRTIEKPKKKNLRHLWLTKAKIVEIERLIQGERVSCNLKLGSIIKALKFDKEGKIWNSK